MGNEVVALWTRKAVQQLIKQMWSIKMPIRTVGEYLKRWGFTPQRPLRRAYKQNPKAVKAWLENDKLSKRTPRFNGEMRQVFAMTVIMVEVIHHMERRLLSAYIQDVSGLI